MGILGTGIQEGLLLKPVRYQWAMDLYEQAVANTWFPNEIQLGEDIADFKRMTDEERHAVTFLMSYFNPSELLVNKALAFGVYPYVNAPEAHLYLAKQMWEEANHCMSFEYVLETFPIDREEAYASHVDIPSMAAKEEFEVEFIRRMSEQTLDITTTAGKQDFVRNLVAYNVILEGIWFYSGFMVALSFRQRNLLRNFGSLVDWIVRDESLHLKFGINLILTVLEENEDLQTPEFAEEIRQMIVGAVVDGGAVQPRPAPGRHPRAERELHQPVREVPGRPPARGARLRGRVQGLEPGEVDGDGERHAAARQLLRVDQHVLRVQRAGDRLLQVTPRFPDAPPPPAPAGRRRHIHVRSGGVVASPAGRGGRSAPVSRPSRA